MPTEVVELRSEAEFREAFPVMGELHGELDEQRYLGLLAEMVPAGYRLFAVRGPEGEIVAAAGVQVLTNLYYERHLYVYDLVATENARSGGYGGTLMDHVEELARREGGVQVRGAGLRAGARGDVALLRAPRVPEARLLDAQGLADYLWLRNANPTATSTIKATTRTTANGMRMTSAALPVVVPWASRMPTIAR